MQVMIEDIKVKKKRIREDEGDIGSLAASLRRFGQINPILLTPDNVLVAGGRRLSAAKMLGWRTINALIVEISDDMDPIEYEIEENLQRQDFNSIEAQKAQESLFRLRHPGFFRKIFRAILKFFRKIFRAFSQASGE
jgi:ParB family chromosome partitioning protein